MVGSTSIEMKFKYISLEGLTFILYDLDYQYVEPMTFILNSSDYQKVVMPNKGLKSYRKTLFIFIYKVNSGRDKLTHFKRGWACDSHSRPYSSLGRAWTYILEVGSGLDRLHPP